MVITVEFDVPLEIVFESANALSVVPAVQQALKHFGNGILSTKEKLRGHFYYGTVLGAGQCARDEVCQVLRQFTAAQSCCGIPVRQLAQKPGKRLVAGAHFIHGLSIEVQVAAGLAVKIQICFFPQHHLVDETG